MLSFVSFYLGNLLPLTANKMEPNKGMFLRRISVELPSDIIQIQMLGLQYTPIKYTS